MRRLILICALLLTVPAWAGIAPVGSGIADHGTTAFNTSTDLYYTPTTGNFIALACTIGTSGTSPSCTDGTNALQQVASVATNNSQSTYLWYQINADVISSNTHYACSWTGGSVNYSCTLQEYSGNTLGVNAGVTASSVNLTCSGAECKGTGITTADISITLDDANDWLLCVFSDAANALTFTTGNSRVVEGTSPKMVLGDNTASSATSVTCSGTQTSTQMRAVAMELRVSGGGGTRTPTLPLMGVGQ